MRSHQPDVIPGGGLAVFRDPRSVAVIGASADPAKWGYWLARGALAGRGRRPVSLVNPNRGQILGVRCVPRVSDLAEAPELIAVSVRAPHVAAVVDEALLAGVRGLLIITAGVPDAGAIAARVSAAGARLAGPASLGIFDAHSDLQLAWGQFTPGPLAVVSQSGQVGSEIALLAAEHSIGISRFVSMGSEADVTAAEVLADLADHPLTRVVAVYLENFAHGAALLGAVGDLRRAGKAVVVIAAGGSEAGQRAARSHTGALATSMEMLDAACRAAGATRVQSPAELVDLCAYLLAAPLPAGRRVGIISDSGGQGALAADLASRAGLSVPALSSELRGTVASILPAEAATANPIDLAGAGERDITSYHAAASLVLDSAEVDAVILTGYFGRYGSDVPPLADAELRTAGALARLAGRAAKPLVVHTMGARTAAAAALRAAGLPVYASVDGATRALGAAAALRENPGRVISSGPPPRPARIPAGYLAARQLLQSAGVPFPAARTVSSAAELESAAAGLHPPYVLKAEWVEHKSEAGGVRLGLADLPALRSAFARMRRRLGPGRYLLEEQDTRPHVVEMLVGARRDPSFGPMVLVGAGGTEAELHADVRIERAPIDTAAARAMIGQLRCAPLLAGWRGRPAVAVGALAAVAVAVARLIADVPGIDQLEINPVRVGPGAVVAVDALVIPATPPPGRARTTPVVATPASG